MMPLLLPDDDALRMPAHIGRVSVRQRPPACEPGATYVVTGGLGVLGLHAAQYLVNQGARRLILTSRRGLPCRQAWPSVNDPMTRSIIGSIQALERQGVSVVPLALDIADETAVARALNGSALDMPPVRGIVHAAGIFKGGLLERSEREELREVLRAKVTGTMVLDRVFPPGSLDFLVLFSSTGYLGRVSGQASYAAANTFMDGFAKYRSQTGLERTLSIGWMAWERLGMSKTIDLSLREAQANGVDAISVSTALASWQTAMDCGAPYAAVFRTCLDETGGRPLPVLSRLAGMAASSDGEGESQVEPWTLVPPENRLEWFVNDIRALVAAELRCAPDDVAPRRSLIDMGMDSLITVALRIGLKKRYRIEVPPTLIWNHPTVDAISKYVRETVVIDEQLSEVD